MQKIHKVHFACGELYLFSDVPRMRDPESCLWGVYDRTDSGKKGAQERLSKISTY